MKQSKQASNTMAGDQSHGNKSLFVSWPCEASCADLTYNTSQVNLAAGSGLLARLARLALFVLLVALPLGPELINVDDALHVQV